MPKEEAVADALDYAIKSNLLDGYFKTQKMEVMNMSLTEFDKELYDRNRRREGFERGAHSTSKNIVQNMLADNLPVEKISLYTGMSVEDVRAIANGTYVDEFEVEYEDNFA